jgi:hypothetical protein
MYSLRAEFSNVTHNCNKVRSEFGYEGRVMYFLDDCNRTIGILKKKTAWYIVLRAIREKSCQFCSKNSSVKAGERSSKMAKRISEIQSWIGFTDEYRKSWTVRLCDCVS